MEKSGLLNELQYVEEATAQRAASRFGMLRTSSRGYEMPCISPSIRTETDAVAVTRNVADGMNPQAIILHLSYRDSYRHVITDFLGRSYSDPRVHLAEPLILPDPESEALSFHCIARDNYLALGTPPTTVKRLLNTCLSKDNHSKGRYNAHTTWKEVRVNYGLTAVKDWLVSNHTAVGAHVFLAPSPIIRSDLETIDEAFTCGYTILDEARSDFHMSGIHLLLHGELFEETDEAAKARERICSEIDKWSAVKEQYSGIFLSFKVRDQGKILLEPATGPLARRTLSEFIVELSERVRKAKGALIVHNFANLTLGIIDSGADIASFRVSGRMQIDTPVHGRKGKRSRSAVNSVMDSGTLADVDVGDLKKRWKLNNSFPVPSCVEPFPFWDTDLKEQRIFRSRIQCGNLVGVGEEYRAAGIDRSILLRDALKNRVKNCDVADMLVDLCPTLS